MLIKPIILQGFTKIVMDYNRKNKQIFSFEHKIYWAPTRIKFIFYIFLTYFILIPLFFLHIWPF